jgi:serine/threonine protein kinase
MDHPAIAKVFDAGSTPEGTPPFVMSMSREPPSPFTATTTNLTPASGLEMFIHVCERVQHAHQKAIIHRDLKPSNILVTEVDGKPVEDHRFRRGQGAHPEVDRGDHVHACLGAMIGTPEYMSPEQALSSGEDIDTRTDVYSLAIIF